MGIWNDIDKETTNLARLWRQLDQETRFQAADAFYRHDFEDEGEKHAEADAYLASALKFRLVAVRKLPAEQRARSLAYAGHLPPTLVSSLLIAFHFEERREMLATFLDALGIRHEGGLISPDQDIPALVAGKLETAIEDLFSKYPTEQVEVYLATLALGDPVNWEASFL